MRRPQDTPTNEDDDEEEVRLRAVVANCTGSHQREPEAVNYLHRMRNPHKLEQSKRTAGGATVAASVLLPLALLHLLTPFAHCLGSEDLNSSSNKQHPSIRSIHSPTFKHSFQRPMLSNRFSPSLHSSLASSSSAGQQHQHLAVQASSSASIFSEPPASSAQALVAPPVSQVSNVSSIEQMMKNALARTVHLNSAGSEPAGVLSEASGSQSGDLQPQVRSRASQQQQQQQVTASVEPESSANSNKESTAKTAAIDAESNSTPDQADPSGAANGHETVYSDQRFANLFARRSSLKKSRLQPFEQVKARPTLPSFIKSPPDPKQFSAAAQAAASGQQQLQATDIRPLAGASSFVQSSRLQQQQQQQAAAKINLANQAAKKASITSNSGNIANNKRANSLAQASQANKSASGPKSTFNKPSIGAAINKPSSSSTSAALSAPNPFNRPPSQPASNDPANVIAMARKRLLANNALESAKLKQQQQQQQKQLASSTN